MKKNVNGVIMDMTEEEVEQFKAFQASAMDIQPTSEERLEALENAFVELVGVVLNGQVLCITDKAW